MARDAQATRRRLLAAAADEFAAHGIAGGRVDRIAAAAGSNKAQIYHYFGSKERLFDAVLDDVVRRVAAEVPIDVRDLAAYAGRLFDRYETDPRIARLAIWYRLERPAPHPHNGALAATIDDELIRIGQAQADGMLPAARRPVDLLTLVLHLSFLWAAGFPELESRIAATSREHRRLVLTDAVRALTTPQSPVGVIPQPA
ncbi:TetR family transcriptional regulator [Dactylosporangium sp. CA-233914]|uniref:TetR family transcriptional regulator n=1 Tax=Dactylosporangium sp. CA-233914 TaxID=3239934 RepID=UPI003D8F4C43